MNLFASETTHKYRQFIFLVRLHSVDGVTVSIGAFQALVPGSTPGRRMI